MFLHDKPIQLTLFKEWVPQEVLDSAQGFANQLKIDVYIRQFNGEWYIGSKPDLPGCEIQPEVIKVVSPTEDAMKK